MNLEHIKGKTFYIKGGTNTGIYLFEDNTAIMIDPGLGGLRPKKINKILEQNNIDLKFIINTHEHDDHYGGCIYFKQDKEELNILSSEYAKLYIENPDLFSKYIIGGKSNGFLDDKLKNKCLGKIRINKTLSEGIIKLNSEDFIIIEIKGHTPGSIGVMTNDKVFFVGDLLVGEDILRKYDFLFIYDIKEYLKSLQKIKDIDFEYLVLGHSKKVISKEDSNILIEKHEMCINKYIYQIRKLLNKPMSLEKILQRIIRSNNLSSNYKEYQFYKSSLISVISYLEELQEISYTLDEGELLYYTKKK
ncbi:MBL fold metallo-hydrolase [Romboutsia maritimum]|uniref:MBL fold metallo-hydrolase n=1 Tax=Romboutsia maritimum TaxID=2020948 RepID=A0A371IUD1_9FIRM|nr:MBL fold metallo-hydrolase [Romboutsia maritimum]RDY24079.1 MBL fold metallo-hydrolase [Romboutsia maritimum]